MKVEMLISIKCQGMKHFSGSDKPRMLFALPIKVEMPTNVGISTFMSRKKIMLSCVEHEKKCYNLGVWNREQTISSFSFFVFLFMLLMNFFITDFLATVQDRLFIFRHDKI